MPIARTVPFLCSAAVVLAGAVHRLRAVFVVQKCNFPDILQEPDGFSLEALRRRQRSRSLQILTIPMKTGTRIRLKRREERSFEGGNGVKTEPAAKVAG